MSGCTQTLKLYSSILAHLRRKHASSDVAQLEVSTSNDDGVLPHKMTDLDAEVEAADESISENHMLLAQRNSALLLLTLKERHRLTQSAINVSVGQLKQMVYHVLQDVKESVQERVSVDVAINDCFDIDPFQGLETEHLQTKFYRDHFNLRVSCVLFLFVVLFKIEKN